MALKMAVIDPPSSLFGKEFTKPVTLFPSGEIRVSAGRLSGLGLDEIPLSFHSPCCHGYLALVEFCEHTRTPLFINLPDFIKMRMTASCLPAWRKRTLLLKLLTLILIPGMVTLPVVVVANPSGANVVHGAASFDGLGTGGLTINQTSSTAIINWQNFSIGEGEWTQFVQPGSSATAINRVVSGNPSAIYGSLSGNGNVMVINPNGIVVGASGVIDVAGAMTLSTLDASNSDLLNGGSTRFLGTGSAGVTNYGAISAGDVIILGDFISNPGRIAADRSVAIGAGGDILVNQTADGATISVRSGSSSITNSGDISGGSVDMRAHGNSYAMAINNSGAIRAKGYNFKGGVLTLRAGNNSGVVNTGSLYARQEQTGQGGQINISGGDVDLQSGRIDASGFVTENGGQINVQADRDLNVGANALLLTDGQDGGAMKLEGGDSATLAGRVSAKSYIGSGGSVDFTSAGTVAVEDTAKVDVSGLTGGDVRIGGGFQGGESDITNATDVTVESGALVIADGMAGDGGEVIVWADEDTMFQGTISAQATGASGNGGFVEVSGKQNLTFDGDVSTLAANGQNGTLLLDPADVYIGGATPTITAAGLVSAVGSNNVIIHTSGTGGAGDIFVQDHIDYTSANSLTFLAHNDITVGHDILNHGSGNINLFAGWDGTTGSAFISDPASATTPLGFAELAQVGDVSGAGIAGTGAFGAYGINSARITVQPGMAGGVMRGISVGSRDGQTNLFAHDVLVMEGGDESNGAGNSAQVGYRLAVNNPTGDINVMANGSVLVDGSTNNPNGGSGLSRGRHAMIGHGGNGSHWTHDASGGADSTVSGNGNLSGDIKVVAKTGVLFVRSGGRFNFAQIGHGGWDVDGSKAGDVSVEGGSIVIQSGQYFSNDNDSYNAAAQIGHGGYSSSGIATGDISVISKSGILGQSGGSQAYASARNTSQSPIQIGHGGIGAGATGTLNANNGDGNTYAIDQNLGGHTGAIFVEAQGGDIELLAGIWEDSYVQVGHGGDGAHGNHTNTMLSDGRQQSGAMKDGITISASRDIIFDRVEDLRGSGGATDEGTRSDDSYVQIGNGGVRSAGRFSGDIDVDAGRDFQMHGGNENSYAQLGHGGRGQDAYSGTPGGNFGHATLTGNIDLDVGRNLLMRSGWNDNNGYSMIGHGGLFRVADKNSGHNGLIDIDVGGNIDMMAGALDRGTTQSGAASRNAFTMIGHGGWRSNGDHWGDITVDGGGSLKIETFRGYRVYNVGADQYSGDINAERSFGKIGHGGYNSEVFHDANGSNAINDNNGAVGGGALVSSDLDAVGLGIGSRGSADITVNIDGDVSLVAAERIGEQKLGMADQVDSDGSTPRPVIEWVRDNFVQIGHGGRGDGNTERNYSSVAVHRGDISVNSGGTLTLKGGATDPLSVQTAAGADEFNSASYSLDNYARIGHGGMEVKVSTEGDIDVAAAGDVVLTAGLNGRSPAVIGHGGQESGHSDNDVDATFRNGNITVLSGGSITAIGSNASAGVSWAGEFSYAKIGMDGVRDAIDSTGDITVAALNDVTLIAGTHDRDAHATIGHGGGDRVRGNQKGDIDVTAGGNVVMIGDAGTANENRSTYVKIGHGTREQNSQGGQGRDTNLNGGTWEGNIYVKAGEDIQLTDAFIGHIDDDSRETNVTSPSGDTLIAASRLNPDYLAGGSGNIIADGNSGFSSAEQGLNGDLRLYMPNRADNQLLTGGATLNGRVYLGNPSTPEAILGVDQRGDENLDFFGPLRQVMNHTVTSGAVELTNNGSPTTSGSLATIDFNYEAGAFDNDLYALVNGLGEFYQLYYNNVIPPVTPPEVPGVTPTTPGREAVAPPPPVGFDYAQFVGADKWERTEWPFGLLDFDGYETFLTSFSASDMVDSPDNYVPRSGLEEALDNAFGRRRWTWRPGVNTYLLSTDGVVSVTSDLAQEQAENRDRMRDRARRGAGKGEMNFFLYEPGTNRYSSLRLFGYPVSDVPAFQSEQ